MGVLGLDVFTDLTIEVPTSWSREDYLSPGIAAGGSNEEANARSSNGLQRSDGRPRPRPASRVAGSLQTPALCAIRLSIWICPAW